MTAEHAPVVGRHPRGRRRPRRVRRAGHAPQSIAEVQRPDGMIPWFAGRPLRPVEPRRGGHGAVGLRPRTTRPSAAYEWLADTQLADGSWFNYYLADGVKDPRLDTNVCAYVAAGLLHHYLVTGDIDVLAALLADGRGGDRLRAALAAPRRLGPLVARPGRPPESLRAADRVVLDLPRAALRGGRRRAPGQGAARLGAGRRPARPRGGPPPRRVRPEGRVRHGLVLPGALRRARRRAGPGTASSTAGTAS